MERIIDFTTDTTLLLQKLHSTWPGAGRNTAFYDGLGMGVLNIDSLNNVIPDNLPAVIGFSDGQENNSVTFVNKEQIIDYAKLKQIPIYTLGYGEADEQSLRAIADSTGGRYYYTPDIRYCPKLS